MKWTEEQIVEWHKQAFPNATRQTQLVKVEDELNEMFESGEIFLQDDNKLKEAIEEVADVYISALVLRERFNSRVGALVYRFVADWVAEVHEIDEKMGSGCAEKVYEAIDAKMDKNVRREWVETTPGYYQHKETIQ